MSTNTNMHWARLSVKAIVEGRSVDLRSVESDFDRAGFVDGVELVRVNRAALTATFNAHDALLKRLAQLKLARLWADFELAQRRTAAAS